nr:hypothetical protein [Mycoplasmopsis bovis]
MLVDSNFDPNNQELRHIKVLIKWSKIDHRIFNPEFQANNVD